MTVNIPLSFKGNTGKKTVIEYVEDDVDELPDSKKLQSRCEGI